MKKTIISIIMLIATYCSGAYSQDTDTSYTRHSVYYELFGQGILYSLNYDYRFSRNLSGRIGYTHLVGSFFFIDSFSITGVPLMLNYLVGRDKHYFELGGGIITGKIKIRDTDHGSFFEDNYTDESNFTIGTATIGYRYQPAIQGLIMRVGFTPFFNSHGALPWVGWSLGHSF